MNDKYQETNDTWNNLASLYQDEFMDLDLYNDTYDHICQSLTRRKAKLLDIGCGPGNITRYLLSQRPDFDIFGIDLVPNMIELARKNNPTARFAVMDGRHIHRLETKYDGIIAGFCLPYLSPAESHALIEAAYDLLNEDGLIYLSFVEGDPGQSGFKTGSGGRVFFQYHPLDDLQAHLVRTGYAELKTFRVRYPTTESAYDIHTILIARKPTSP